jgi:hypothetical protein
MEPQSLIVAEFKTPLENAPAFSSAPATLESLLSYLEANGHVRVSLHLHKVAKSEDGSWTVSPTESVVLEIGVKETENQDFAAVKISASKVGSWVSIPKLKESPSARLIYRLSFDAATNKLMPGFPGVYLRTSTALNKGHLQRLA